MGKRITQQKRGKGSPTYRSPSHRSLGKINHYKRSADTVKGTVIDIVHCPGHNCPIAIVEYLCEDGTKRERVLLPAVERQFVGAAVEAGANAQTGLGNVLPIARIPDGTAICCLEFIPGDGGRVVRNPGSYAYILSRSDNGARVNVRLPSRRVRSFNSKCSALIGIVAGGGVTEKPLVKAGAAHHKMHARNRRWPIVHPINMNPVDHPYGGGGHKHIGKAQTVSRDRSPGRKVGSISASRMGRKTK